MCKLIYLLILAIGAGSASAAPGVVYFDARTRKILDQSLGPSIIGTDATNIATAPINFPVTWNGIEGYWDGTKVVTPTLLQSNAELAATWHRKILQLRCEQAQAGGELTQFEVNLFARDIELLQRRIAALQAGR